jgi:hypothetical protein
MTRALTLSREQRDAFREGVDRVLWQLRVDDLRAFDSRPWGVIRMLSACALVRERLGGDRCSYRLELRPEILELALLVSSDTREYLEDCRLDLRGRIGPIWSEEDRRQCADEARESLDGFLDTLAAAEQIREAVG